MLEQVDLTEKLPAKTYKQSMRSLDLRFAALQRRAIESGLPVIVVFEGWEAAGKGTLINRMVRELDRRHLEVYLVGKATEDEDLRPYYWRFWRRLPPRGTISVFNRSWYTRVLQDRVNGAVKKHELPIAYDDINHFEKLLADDGTLVIKLFLHISKKEQERRYRKLETRKETAWRITKDDWVHHKHYKKYETAAEETFAQTNTPIAPWHVIPAEHRRLATVRMMEVVSTAMENRLDHHGPPPETGAPPPPGPPGKPESALEQIDLSKSISREAYDARIDRYQKRLRDLEYQIYAERIPVVIVYEGWDAAGKGGNIKRLTQSLDPRGYEVVPFGAPNEVERRYHYLWRFWNAIPKAGHITIFDRSWYGRVLVERVEKLCTETVWQRAYEEINDMEAQLVRFGAVLVKFWLQIDKEEQLRRFRDRQNTPHKRWKITDEDWRNREKWDDYAVAVGEMLARTDTTTAPWTVVESNCKLYARLKTLRTVIGAIKARLE
jgi:polyphosphate:AMP phosphotransferase